METHLAESIGREARIGRAAVAAGESVRTGASYLVRHDKPSLERRRIEDFIARKFAQHFQASVREYMPTLTALYNETGSLTAAVGCRAAASERLFLEAYTNAPIELLLSAETGSRVSRAEIVEVGSLACDGGLAAVQIVLALVPALIEEGFSWVVFTGADTVRNVFRRLNLKPIALCIANKSMLGERQYEWGTYYDHSPIVMAGKLADGVAALEPFGGAH